MARRRHLVLALACCCGLAQLPAAHAGTPSPIVVTPGADGQAKVPFSGTVGQGGAVLASPDLCFGADKRPAANSGCDVTPLDLGVTPAFYTDNSGALTIRVSDFGDNDLDLAVYKRNPDGTVGEQVAYDGQLPSFVETVAIAEAAGAYYVAVSPYTVFGASASYMGLASFVSRRRGDPVALNRTAPLGFPNYRASRDKFTSHSETTVAMDPLDHRHLLAGSKMYENNEKYLFKSGSYESFDGGRTWKDLGQLPGYCQEPGQCDPADENRYRTVSDPTIAFDDEGTAYYNVLDAPGGTSSFKGFNMTVHIKRPGQDWTNPTTVHDNRTNGLTAELFLDDKNWIAVDNQTDVDGGPNRPRDGKTGTIYICWSFDGTEAPAAGLPVPLQQIVIMRSRDGGRTWGGLNPGDNIPIMLSQKTLISGIGCHVVVGPKGEVYVTWYDNQTNLLMQAKSTDRGTSWTPAYPIGLIDGVNEPFAGEAFRNLSIPATAVDSKGTVYVVVASRNGAAQPVVQNAPALGRALKAGTLTPAAVAAALVGRKGNDIARHKFLAEGDGGGPLSGADIILTKSTDGGESWSRRVRVNQDAANNDGDQFQPWMAVTESGQVNVSYFDRRDDPKNYFVSTYLSRSNDGGATWHDTRVESQMWDPAINTPTSVSGKFIGDYQGLVADDNYAYPFWNSTQHASLPKTDKDYSPYQEAFSARIPNRPASFINSAGTALKLRPLTARQVSRLRGKARSVRLSGTSNDPSGGSVARVDVSIRKKVGSRCTFYAAVRRAFIRRACNRPLYFRVASGAGRPGYRNWVAVIPRRSVATGGGYSIASKATNNRGVVERDFERFRNTRAIYVRTPPKAKPKPKPKPKK